MMSVYGKKCLIGGCRGAMNFEVRPASLPLPFLCFGTTELTPLLHTQYADSKLYDQILYFDTILDTEKALLKSAGTTSQGSSSSSLFSFFSHLPLPSLTDEIVARVNASKSTLDTLRKVVTKHLEKNGRRWVSMEGLFSFMKV
jgi:DNA polymerase alpha subunit A